MRIPGDVAGCWEYLRGALGAEAVLRGRGGEGLTEQ